MTDLEIARQQTYQKAAYQRAYYQAHKDELAEKRHRKRAEQREIMPRKPYQHRNPRPAPRATELYQYICDHPGISTAALDKVFRGSMPERLASLEPQGLLVSEDEYGCLYPFIEDLVEARPS